MALNPNGSSEYKWKYKEGELELTGTILTMQEVQAREFTQDGRPGRPRFWPEGNPVLNIRLGLADPNGNFRSVTFAEAGKKQKSGEKPSLHMDLYRLSNGAMSNLIGKTIHLWTWPANPQTGQPWGNGNPRQFGVELVDQTYALAQGIGIPDDFLVDVLLCNDAVHGGQVMAPNPQMIQQPQVPPMQGNFYAPPVMQPMQQSYPFTQQQPAQYQPQSMPMQQQPAMQPAMQQQPMQQMNQMPTTQAMPPQQQMPQGMDPAIAAAMQAVGATNVQQVNEVYDDIPFD